MSLLAILLVWGTFGGCCYLWANRDNGPTAEQKAALERLNLRYKVTVGTEREGGFVLGGAGLNFISPEKPSKVYYCSEYRDVNGAVEFDAYDENAKALGKKRVSGDYTIDEI